MARTMVPSRAALAGGAATVLWIGGVLLTHAAGASNMIEALNSLDQVSGLLVTGALADDYAPLMKEGFMASVGGAAAVVTAVGGYGIALSISRGYGADSVLSFMFTGPTTFTFFLLMPLLAMEGVLGALVANAVRGRWRKRTAV